MQWIKQIVVDVLATAVIAIAVFFETQTLSYVVYIYTGLLVLARLLSLSSSNFRAITKKKVSEAPVWVYHLLYFLNVLILSIGMWFITAAGWVFIWGVATYVQRNNL